MALPIPLPEGNSKDKKQEKLPESKNAARSSGGLGAALPTVEEEQAFPSKDQEKKEESLSRIKNRVPGKNSKSTRSGGLGAFLESQRENRETSTEETENDDDIVVEDIDLEDENDSILDEENNNDEMSLEDFLIKESSNEDEVEDQDQLTSDDDNDDDFQDFLSSHLEEDEQESSIGDKDDSDEDISESLDDEILSNFDAIFNEDTEDDATEDLPTEKEENSLSLDDEMLIDGGQEEDEENIFDIDIDEDEDFEIEDNEDDKEKDKKKPKNQKPKKKRKKEKKPQSSSLKPVKELYFKIHSPYYSVLKKILVFLSSIPIIGIPFKILSEKEKILWWISHFLPLIIVFLIWILPNTLAVSNSLEETDMPDQASASASVSSFDVNENIAIIEIENTGEVIIDTRVDADIYSTQLGINPLTWFIPSQSVSCSTDWSIVEQGDIKTVEAECEGSPSGFWFRGSVEEIY